MPVSKNKLKVPRLYLESIRKSCKLSRKEFAKIIGVSTSSVDRYENGSCDYKPENMPEIFTAISELSGVSATVLIEYEADYQKKVIDLNCKEKRAKISMPFLHYQKQMFFITAYQKHIGLNALSAKEQSIIHIRMEHPDWTNKQIADELLIPVIKVHICFFNIKKQALKFMEENRI